MAVKSNGSLKFSEIASEFGATPPYKMSQFYRGAKVPDISNNTTVPSNGVIRFNNFYNTLNVFLFIQSIEFATLFYNIKSAAIAAGWNQVLPLHAKITNNNFIYSNSTGSYAFSTGSGFPSNTRLELYNNYVISGCGGSFGVGATSGVQATNGGNGGPGILAEHQLYIRNNATIGGGGGGGGGGASSIYLTPSIIANGGRGGVGAGNGFTSGEVGLVGQTLSATLTGVTYTATGGRGGNGGGINSSGGSGSLGTGNRGGFISANNRPGGVPGNGIAGTYSFF